MRKSRISALVVVAVSLAAWALPAAAQAEGPSWYMEEVFLNEEESAEISTFATQTFFVPLVNLTVGPCNSTTTENEIWNATSVGKGVRTKTAFEEKCATQTAGCKVDLVAKNLAWPMEAIVGLEGNEVAIETGVEIVPEKNMACGSIGLGKPVLFAGTLTGAYNNATNCVEYNEASKLSAGGAEVQVTGKDCFVDLNELLLITLG